MKNAKIAIAFIAGIAVAAAFAACQREPAQAAAAEAPLVLPRADEWTPESVSDDPLGFAEFAERNVRKDLVFLEQSGAELERKRSRARRALSTTRSFLISAEERTADLKKAYQMADAEAAFPVSVGKQVYDREQLIEEATTLISLKNSYEEIVPTYETVLQSIDESKVELEKSMLTTNSIIPELEREKQLLYNNQESVNSQSFLASVERQLDQNELLLGQANRPVPVVEDLLQNISHVNRRQVDKEAIIAFLSNR